MKIPPYTLYAVERKVMGVIQRRDQGEPRASDMPKTFLFLNCLALTQRILPFSAFLFHGDLPNTVKHADQIFRSPRILAPHHFLTQLKYLCLQELFHIPFAD